MDHLPCETSLAILRHHPAFRKAGIVDPASRGWPALRLLASGPGSACRPRFKPPRPVDRSGIILSSCEGPRLTASQGRINHVNDPARGHSRARKEDLATPTELLDDKADRRRGRGVPTDGLPDPGTRRGPIPGGPGRPDDLAEGPAEFATGELGLPGLSRLGGFEESRQGARDGGPTLSFRDPGGARRPQEGL